MAQKVNNLRAMQEVQVQSLGWEDPLQKGMATHSSILFFFFLLFILFYYNFVAVVVSSILA